MSKAEEVTNYIKKLSQDAIQQLLDLVKHILSASSLEKPCCPYCENANIIRYGHKCGKQRFLCKHCGRTFVTTTENPNCHFQKVAVPVPPLSHSLSTPSLIAQVMYQKFMMGFPLARQERDWYRLGLVLPRSDMANWIIRCCQEWLEPNSPPACSHLICLAPTSYCKNSPTTSFTSFPSAFPLTLGISTFMIFPLSLAPGASMPASTSTALIISRISASSIIFGA